MSDEKRKVPYAVWCPNCGVPRNSSTTLKNYLMRGDKELVFACRACGTVLDMRLHRKSEPSSVGDETNAKEVIADINDVTKLASAGSKLFRLVK